MGEKKKPEVRDCNQSVLTSNKVITEDIKSQEGGCVRTCCLTVTILIVVLNFYLVESCKNRSLNIMEIALSICDGLASLYST